MVSPRCSWQALHGAASTFRHTSLPARRHVIHKPEMHNLSQRCYRRTEPRKQGICMPNFEDRSNGSRDMLVDKQIDTDTETGWSQQPTPLQGQSNDSESNKLYKSHRSTTPQILCLQHCTVIIAASQWTNHLNGGLRVLQHVKFNTPSEVTQNYICHCTC